MLHTPKILLLTGNDDEERGLQNGLGDYAFLTRVANAAEVQSHLAKTGFDAVLCSWTIHPADWGGPLHQVRELCPDLPIILLSPSGCEREWKEVLEAETLALLTLPFWGAASSNACGKVAASPRPKKAQRFAEVGCAG